MMMINLGAGCCGTRSFVKSVRWRSCARDEGVDDKHRGRKPVTSRRLFFARLIILPWSIFSIQQVIARGIFGRQAIEAGTRTCRFGLLAWGCLDPPYSRAPVNSGVRAVISPFPAGERGCCRARKKARRIGGVKFGMP
jgi:hypothetical protein